MTKTIDYETRIKGFDEEHRPFRDLDFIIWHDIVETPADAPKCGACGSSLPKSFHRVEDKNGEKFYIGRDCFKHLTKTWKGRCESCHQVKQVIGHIIDLKPPKLGYAVIALCAECSTKYLENLRAGDIELLRRLKQ